jgi:hypothetical protein
MAIVDNLVHDAEISCRNTATSGAAPVTLFLQTKPVEGRLHSLYWRQYHGPQTSDLRLPLFYHTHFLDIP